MNKTIEVMDIKGLSTDNLVEYYRTGYRLEERNNNTKVLSLGSCKSGNIEQGSTKQVIIQAVRGTPPYKYEFFSDNNLVQSWINDSTRPQAFNNTFNDIVGNHTFKIRVTDSCPNGSKVVEDTCSINVIESSSAKLKNLGDVTSYNIYSNQLHATCTIKSGYFTLNGMQNPPSCVATYDVIVRLQCIVEFAGSYTGKQFKAEFKFKLPTGNDFSFYTPLMSVSQTHTFTSEKFINPIPLGTYSTVWFTVYDSSGATICANNGKGSGRCESITIVNYPPPPSQRYKCSSGICSTDPNGQYPDLGSCQAACKITPPPAQRYRCSSGSCIPDSNGQYPDLASCQSVCTVVPPPSVVCPQDQVNIGGTCVNKQTLILGGAIFIALMVLS